MGSSNMDDVTTGDIEAQRHNPKWFVDHKRMLRSNENGEANQLGYFILKVPEYYRQPPTAFSPVGWRFGLHNRENLDSSGSEAIKLAIAVQYGLVGEKWDRFCDAIVDDPRAMLACYGLQNGVTNWTDEQIKHVLALDALFLAIYIDIQFPLNESRLWTSNLLPSCCTMQDAQCKMWVNITDRDICLVENQIPFVLIDKVVEYINNFVASLTFGGNQSLIDDLQQYQQKSVEIAVKAGVSCFMDTSGEAFKIGNSCLLDAKMHILGVAYKVICGCKGLLVKSVYEKTYIHVPSATKLKQSGIKIVGVGGPLETMSYKKKCLSLPKVRMYTETSSIIRNMAWHESQSISNGCLFNDYISLMIDLIQTREDLELLVESGVIYNPCGLRGFEIWTSLENDLVEIPSSEAHHDMKVAIKKRCGLRRYRLWSEFIIVFCSKPWLVLSTIAVILVTMATLVQTYVAIIGSNKMMPKFP